MGTLITITGNGKGKTTSALGSVARALGHDQKVAVLQFIKSEPERFGEYKFFTKQGVIWETFGTGFCWTPEDFKRITPLVKQGWNRFKELYESKTYNLIVLDELTYLITNKILDEDEICDYLEKVKRENNTPNVIITGRGASDKLIKVSDTVSDIHEIKHHYKTLQQKAQKAIEY